VNRYLSINESSAIAGRLFSQFGQNRCQQHPIYAHVFPLTFDFYRPSSLLGSVSSPSIPIPVHGVHVKVEHTHEIDLESAINMKTSDYATLHSASSEKTVHVTFPDLERGGSDDGSIATRHPDYFHFPSPPPSPPSHPPNH
jgi:hypothetical protein